MAALNRHEVDDVAEYSVWALVKENALGLADLGLRAEEFSGKAPQVRRWLNRFVTKRSDIIAENIDLIRQSSVDGDERPREGLALGLATE
jgi:hypothetical protein